MNRLLLQEGILVHEKKMGIYDSVEVVHTKKFYSDKTTTTELTSAFFISKTGCRKSRINKFIQKVLRYTNCDILIIDQSNMYPSQEQIEALAIECGITKIPKIGYCFDHVVSLIVQDFVNSRLIWRGNEDGVPCELDYNKFKQLMLAFGEGARKGWALKIYKSLKSFKALSLDLKCGAWFELCKSGVIFLLSSHFKRSSNVEENMSRDEYVLLSSSLKALKLLCMVTCTIEGFILPWGISIDKNMSTIVAGLTVLTYSTKVKSNSLRSEPTSNLETSYALFEEIHAKLIDFVYKDMTIVTLYRLRGDLRALSNGLMPTVQVKYYCAKERSLNCF